jgi:hypothetical protein
MSKLVIAELEGRFGRSDPADWQTQYTPAKAREYAAEVADLEDQLDLGWPDWRERRSFVHVSSDKAEWIKIRLLRRDLILLGQGDWGIRVEWRTRDGKRWPIAISVRPTTRKVDRAAYRPIVTTPLLSERLAMPLGQVEEMLTRLPDGVRDVRSWLVGERGRAPAAPLPGSSDPLPDQPRHRKGAA